MEDNVKKMETQYESAIKKQKKKIHELERKAKGHSDDHGYLEEMNSLAGKIGLQGKNYYKQLLLPF